MLYIINPITLKNLDNQIFEDLFTHLHRNLYLPLENSLDIKLLICINFFWKVAESKPLPKLGKKKDPSAPR